MSEQPEPFKARYTRRRHQVLAALATADNGLTYRQIARETGATSNIEHVIALMRRDQLVTTIPGSPVLASQHSITTIGRQHLYDWDRNTRP